MLQRQVVGVLTALVLLFFTGTALKADNIPTGEWLGFAFADPGTPAFGCGGACQLSSSGDSTEAGDPNWTFTSASPVLVTITDAFTSGDDFQLFDFGTLVGSTPVVDIGYDCGDDPAVCALDPNLSHASFLFGAGDHSLSIDVGDSPDGGGSAYFRVDSQAAAVPEPATVLLVLSGITALSSVYRRHR